MPIKESGEMYLETIYLLSREGGDVRSVDVAEHMGFSKPSVSRAVGLLRREGLISVDGNGFITLSERGESAAAKIVDRHNVLTTVLERLGVDKETASADACRIEHVISDTTFEALKSHIEKNKD